MRDDHIICHDATGGEMAYAMECLRCGAVQRVTLPMSVDCYRALAKAFAREHRNCQAKSRSSGSGGR